MRPFLLTIFLQVIANMWTVLAAWVDEDCIILQICATADMLRQVNCRAALLCSTLTD